MVLYQSYFTTIVGQVSSLLTLLPVISKGLESVSSIGEILLTGEDLRDEDVDYMIRSVSEVVGYLRSFSPIWRDLESGKKPHIL